MLEGNSTALSSTHSLHISIFLHEDHTRTIWVLTRFPFFFSFDWEFKSFLLCPLFFCLSNSSENFFPLIIFLLLSTLRLSFSLLTRRREWEFERERERKLIFISFSRKKLISALFSFSLYLILTTFRNNMSGAWMCVCKWEYFNFTYFFHLFSLSSSSYPTVLSVHYFIIGWLHSTPIKYCRAGLNRV